jgi:hypothetical protein
MTPSITLSTPNTRSLTHLDKSISHRNAGTLERICRETFKHEEQHNDKCLRCSSPLLYPTPSDGSHKD